VRTDHDAVARTRLVLDELEQAWRGRADRMAELLRRVPQPENGKPFPGQGG
jgi:hypothetical protein